MSNLENAFHFAMLNEDAKLSGKVTKDSGDTLARFGINSGAHPELIALGFFDESEVDNKEAFGIAREVFEKDYWLPAGCDKIENDVIAAKLADAAYNMGAHQAVHLLQRAANAMGAGLVEDGNLGSKSAAAINALDSGALVSHLCDFIEQFYRHVAAVKPEHAGDLHGWLIRAAKVPEFVKAASK